MINSLKEAINTLEKPIDLINDSFEKNQAIDAINYLRQNAFDKSEVVGIIETLDDGVERLRMELEI